MISPYGGVELNDGFLDGDGLVELEELEQRHTPTLICDHDVQIECQRICDGSFNPVGGFFTCDDVDAIIKSNVLRDGTYFPMPIVLQVPREWRGNRSQSILLADETKTVFGCLTDVTVYEYSVEEIVQFIFKTNDPKHPGVFRFLKNGNTLMSGTVRVRPLQDQLSSYCLSPRESRKRIHERKWHTCVGFQTRNIPHRAHEYLQRIAMELFDGIFIHPIIGWKKEGDYSPDVVMRAYKYLVENIYLEAKVLLSGLRSRMYYAGPREAILHAVIRQNYGCSHFIVGRDHAGVGRYYGKYEAHERAREVQKYLGITILCLKGPYYCTKCGCIATENTCRHEQQYHQEVRGTDIRSSLSSGKEIPDHLIRRAIINELREFTGEIFLS